MISLRCRWKKCGRIVGHLRR